MEMKLLTSSQDRELFTSLLDLNWPWVSLGQHTRKKGKMLDGKKAYGNVMGSIQYLEDRLQN